VFGHGLAAVEALDVLMARGENAPDPLGIRRETQGAIEWWSQARDYFDEPMPSGGRRVATLKLCGLLHDIAKPATKTIDPDGRIRFNGHSDQGATMAVKIMRRLRYPAREVRVVERMIAAHLRPMELARVGAPSRKAVHKFFRDTEDASIDTLVLSLADHAGSQGPDLKMDGWTRHLAVVNYLVGVQYTEPEIIRPPKLVDGDDLMAEFGLAQGPLLGDLLDAVQEATAAGEVSTKEEALSLAREHMEQLVRSGHREAPK
jgi:poly(A) polymerase